MNYVIVYGVGAFSLLFALCNCIIDDVQGGWGWRLWHPMTSVPLLLGVVVIALAATGHVDG